MTGSRRHRARIFALQALYETDCSSHPVGAILHRLLNQETVASDIGEFAQDLIDGVNDNSGKIDAIIHEYAPAFPVKQLSAIDRNIMRIAIFEMVFDRDVPYKSVINEAVELAKHFSTEKSPKFINGVLGAIVKHGIPTLNTTDPTTTIGKN